MTNGEKVMETFPGGETKRGYYGINSLPLVIVTFGTIFEGYEMAFLESWWDAEYKKPSLEPVRAYQCDPEKNTDCKKTGCYERGGPCKLTLNPEYAKEERNGKNES